MATTIVLVRHGETDWNRERRFQGHADVPLNEAGRAQVRALAARLDGEKLLGRVHEPAPSRCRNRRDPRHTLGLEVRSCEALKEVHVGSWSGLTVPEVEDRFPDGHRRWVGSGAGGWDDGETYDELGRRVLEGLRWIGEAHRDDNVLAVTHGGPIRAILAAVRGLSFEASRDEIAFVENCEAVRVTIQDGILEAVH